MIRGEESTRRDGERTEEQPHSAAGPARPPLAADGPDPASRDGAARPREGRSGHSPRGTEPDAYGPPAAADDDTGPDNGTGSSPEGARRSPAGQPAPGAAGSGGSPALGERVLGDEPLLAARVHRPADLMRMLFGLLGIALVLAVAAFAIGTTKGLEEDIGEAAQSAPPLVISFAGMISSIAVLVVPVAFAVERLIKRDGLRIADGVLAAVLAHGVSLSFGLWVARMAPREVQDALTSRIADGTATEAVHGYLAPIIAYMTAVGMAHRPRWRVLMWAVLVLDAVSVLVADHSTPFSILVTVLIGWTVAYGTLYAVGTPNVRPTGQQLLAGLRHVGFRPVTAMRAEDPAEAAPAGEGDREREDAPRRYLVTLESGPPLDVIVVDRGQQAQGFFYRLWRRLALRGLHQRRSLQSLRQALEQEALVSYAAIAAGANAPRLIAANDLGPDAVMLVYEHIGGRVLDAVPEDEITDELMRNTWQQVRALQARRIAHRQLVGGSLLLDRSGRVFLTDLGGGEIAAGELLLRMDVAQLLTTFGLRVGARRSVAAAVDVLGPDAVADALPLLQPIALSRSTRQTLRQLGRERAQRERQVVLDASRAYREAGGTLPEGADRKTVRAARQAEKNAMEEALAHAKEPDLLSEIRNEVLRIRPQAPVEPARLERVRPRTLVSLIAGVFAAYVLLSQITNVNITEEVAGANWGWVVAALAFSALTYFAAALGLLGFVPEKVPYLRTVLAQVAGSFVKLVAPAAIGGVALNTRYLQRSGVRPGHAVASVGAHQLFGFASAITLLFAFAYITGTQHAPTQLSPSPTVIAGLLTVAVAVLIITAVPGLRRFLSERINVLFAGVVPRMLDVVQQPRKLLSGLGGTVAMTFAFVLCLDASVRAFGGELGLAAVAVVFLAGNALGSAAPTPGGLGAVEAAMVAGLIALGVPKETATPAVLLFRLVTFWLPVLPGWVCFTHLTRRGNL
ncbi:flippase-like domain-containing protein [Streptomyces sp. YIM 98790]|uniref:flippase-like domain-containing protein n=1 Tax=Streptomyces sp. YIM 98790 TaxID=2689077 RepID=UPI0028BF34CD|nr:flippase-like domain-containing protein [Streptomyces sp. YIM 98790]